MKDKLSISIFIFIAVLFFSGCSSNDNDNNSFTYPAQLGNIWEYQTTTVQNYTDSDNNPVTVTLNSNNIITVHAVNEEVNSINTILFHELTIDDFYGPAEGYNYYEITPSGMRLIAYYGQAFLSMPKKSTGDPIRLHGYSFSDINDLQRSLEFSKARFGSVSDSLIIENIPPQVYRYPFTINEQWTYRPINNPIWRIDKRVISREFVTTNAGSFECYKIQWLYDLDNDSQWDDDILFFDYVTSSGLIKRTIEMSSVAYTDPDNPDGGEFSMQVLTTMELETLQIN